MQTLLAHLAAESEDAKALADALDGRGASVPEKLRALLTIRPPAPLPAWAYGTLESWLAQQSRATVDASALPPMRYRPGGTELVLWKGDITRLKIDGIVNAANPQMLGCFSPFHACIDNAIHWAAGPRLREDCQTLMQGASEPAGQCRITDGHRLPAAHVLHTVGPVIAGQPTDSDRATLAQCYHSCLTVANAHDLRSLAFCCISTGVYGYPAAEAVDVALDIVERWLIEHPGAIDRVVFDVFSDADLDLYTYAMELRSWS